MRQYCSGGSSTWSSIQPLPGRLQQRVVEEEARSARRGAAPGRPRRWPRRRRRCARTRGTPRRRRRSRRRTAARRLRRGRSAGLRRARRPRRSGPRRVDARRPACAAGDAPAGRPGPRRSPRRAPASAPASRSAASGRICSAYSGSAPSVNPSCHQPALALPQVVGVGHADVLGPARVGRHQVPRAMDLARGPRRRPCRAATQRPQVLERGLLAPP